MDDNSGTVQAHYEYSPFGKISSQTGALQNDFDFRFSSECLDSETELVYYNFRYYIPELGRWGSRDPIGEKGGINLYGFINNDSINSNDMLGQCQKGDCEYKLMNKGVRFSYKLSYKTKATDFHFTGVDIGKVFLGVFMPTFGIHDQIVISYIKATVYYSTGYKKRVCRCLGNDIWAWSKWSYRRLNVSGSNKQTGDRSNDPEGTTGGVLISDYIGVKRMTMDAARGAFKAAQKALYKKVRSICPN